MFTSVGGQASRVGRIDLKGLAVIASRLVFIHLFPRLCQSPAGLGVGRACRSGLLQHLTALLELRTGRAVTVKSAERVAQGSPCRLVLPLFVRPERIHGLLPIADRARQVGDLGGQRGIFVVVLEHEFQCLDLFSNRLFFLQIDRIVGGIEAELVVDPAKFAVCPLQHGGDGGTIAVELGRHLECALVGQVMVDIGPGMLQDCPHLDLRPRGQ